MNSQFKKLIFQSNVLFSFLEQEYQTEQEIPEEFVKEIEKYSKEQQINTDLLFSFQNGERVFSINDYLTIINNLNFLDNINLKKAIFYFKYIYINVEIGIYDLDRIFEKIEHEEDLYLSLCKYDYAEDLIYFNNNEEKLGLMVSILYDSKKCIDYFEQKKIERFEEINDDNIYDIVTLWFEDEEECKLLYGPIKYWDVSKVTDMSHLFYEREKFNEDISRWNVSNAIDMNHMFCKAKSFNPDISKWNVSNVEDMSYMFSNATSFNSDISKWNVSNVIMMQSMFKLATSFNSDISKWNVSNVEDMGCMFCGAKSFNSDISKWNVSNVLYMKCMFQTAESFNSDISNWDVSNVENMYCLFHSAYSFNSDLSKWDVSSVKDMGSMFYQAYSFNSDLSKWNVERVINMSEMFYQAYSFNSNLLSWNTKYLRYSFDVFKDCNIDKNFIPHSFR